MPQLTPENAIEVINDETRPTAERFAAMAYLNTREILRRLPAAPAANSTLPAPAAAAAKPARTKAADVIDRVRLTVSCDPHSGTGRDGRPWANVLCWKEVGGERDSLKLTTWNAERVSEISHLRRGDEIEVEVREYDKETWEGRTTKTARPASIRLLQRAPPPPPQPRDNYDDFLSSQGQSAPQLPQVGADGWPAGSGDLPF